jgi:mono/diheme cytochrome c family protein
MNNTACLVVAAGLLASLAVLPANAADERFWKDRPGATTGVVAATEPAYAKECGSCHFPYSPGLLPQRSWKLHMERLDKHFGEAVRLAPESQQAITRYLVDNAADVSRYEGSKVLMEQVATDRTPYRLRDVPLFHRKHSTILEVINVKPRVKVRALTNCGDCHQRAAEGDFSERALLVPGLKTGQ